MSSPTRRISRFPRGSTLQCTRCEKTGTVGEVTAHTARSRRCKGAAIIMVKPPPGITSIAVPVHQARARSTDAEPPPPPEPELVEAPPPPDDPEDPGDDDEDLEDDEEEGAEFVTTARSAGKAPVRRARLGRRPILRPGAPGAARVEEPAPTTAKIEIEIWASNAARFDGARYDPDLAFDGTLADFVNEVIEVHFTECLGLDLRLSRRHGRRLEIA